MPRRPSVDEFEETEGLIAGFDEQEPSGSSSVIEHARTTLGLLLRPRSRLKVSRKAFLLSVTGAVLLVTLTIAANTGSNTFLSSLFGSSKARHYGDHRAKTQRPWVKPEGFKIVGMVFFGRRAYVDVLDCYLRRNLVSYGGYLDEVVFLENTANAEDLAYLEHLLASEPSYRLQTEDFDADNDEYKQMSDWKHMWGSPFDDNTMYVKIDDDVVFVDEDAVPEIVHTLMDHPEAHSVQSNVVNSPSTSWYHYHGGAVFPYLPEIVPPPEANMTTWRPSELPRYPSEVAPDSYPWPEEYHDKWSAYEVGQEGGPPFANHRWLPMADTSAALHKTPIAATDNDVWGRAWDRWAIGAQQHYSLFENIERGTMDNYHFGNGAGLYDTRWVRYKINFFAFWGRTLNRMKPGADDEFDLTETIPKALGMPVLVQTRSIVAHFSFGPQREIWHTDLLRRYRAYANEYVCAADNQKVEITTEEPGKKMNEVIENKEEE